MKRLPYPTTKQVRQQILDFLAQEPQTPAIQRQIDFLQADLLRLEGKHFTNPLNDFIS
jgi:hypothetical protein